MRRVGWIVVPGLLLALTTACSPDEATAPSPDGTAADVTLGWARVAPVDVALPDGTPFTGDRPAASKPVLVNLWASWCGPCKKELPQLERFGQTGGVSVVGVSEDSDTGTAEHALSEASVTYPSWLDDQDHSYLSSLARLVPQALPSSLLLVDGQVVAVHIGAFTSPGDFAPIAAYVKEAG